MPMNMLTLVQTVEVFSAYLFVSAWLPAFVFGKKLKEHRLIERFVIYFMIGNFYIINLVYLLQLLKISYPVTLGLGTFVPAVLGRLVLNKTPVRQIVEDRLSDLKKVVRGSMGRRTALFRIFRAAGRQVKAAGRFVGELLVHHGIDCLLLAAFLGMLLCLHGISLFTAYGYKASDIPVHNFWINAMGENNIFVAGVYPHGFHCVIYYLHALFGFATFNVLRLFGFVEAIMVNVMLLLFLKLCCKSSYTAYAGAFLYAGSRYFAEATYSRFYAALPQEFGMIFIFPTVYFGFAYFETKYRELAGKEKPKKERKRFRWKKGSQSPKTKTPHLALETAAQVEAPGEAEAAAASLTEAAAPLEAAVPLAEVAAPPEEITVSQPEPAVPPPEEAGKKRRLLRLPGRRNRREKKARAKRQWQKTYLYLAGFAMSFSMTLTVHFYGTMVAGIFCLAMAIGYGFLFLRKDCFRDVVLTCLLSVFIAVLPMAAAFAGGTPLQGSLGWGLGVIFGSQEETAEADAAPAAPAAGTAPAAEAAPVEKKPDPPPTIGERLEDLIDEIEDLVDDFRTAIYRPLYAAVLRLPESKIINWVIAGFAVLIGAGIALFLLRQRCYGAMLISSGLYLFFMGIMMSARSFGLPSLMDTNRGGIYYAYSLPLLAAFLPDGVLALAFLPFRQKYWKWVRNLFSLAFVALVVWHTWSIGQLRAPRDTRGQEMNEAIVCMENIIETEEDFTWTVVSANDELRMGTDYGYHYETITFLEDMEGGDNWSRIRIRIPTPVVYIFVEKIPLDYFEHYEGSGQSVSEEGAARALPRNSGISMYQGEKRWILMSRMYYWAQEFQRLYPNELDVYLETEQFICYRIEQNMYRLYDFAIDYDYNTRDYTAAEESA